MKNAKDEIDLLDKFRRHELAAVETYSQAIDKLNGSGAEQLLDENRSSHAERSVLLGEQIRLRGGKPAEDSGAWGAFTRLVEGGARLFGEKAAMKALEEGEDHGCRLYDRDLDEYSAEFREFVKQELREPQRVTHDLLANATSK